MRLPIFFFLLFSIRLWALTEDPSEYNPISTESSFRSCRIFRLLGLKSFPHDYKVRSETPFAWGGSSSVFIVSYEGSPKVTVRKYLDVEREGQEFTEDHFSHENIIYAYLKDHKFKSIPEYYGLKRDEKGKIYIEMGLLEGQNYFTFLQRRFLRENNPKECLKEALKDFGKIFEAVEELHKTHVAHFDLKGQNIFLGSHNRIKILDFSGAQIEQPISTGGGRFHAVTSSTPEYSAPEVKDNIQEVIDYRADIFSLAKIIERELLPQWELRANILRFDEEKIRKWKESLQKNVLDKALAKDPADRYQSVAEFRAALSQWTRRWFW